MKLFECMIEIDGSWRKVQVNAENDRDAYVLLCGQYGDEAVKGYPNEVTKPFWS